MKRWGWLLGGVFSLAGLVWAAETEPAPSAGATPDITFVQESEGAGEAENPANPFAAGEESGVRKDAVPGYVELSSGAKVPGRIFTTRAERVKIFNLEKEVYEYVPVPAVRKIETVIEWERMEKDWRFKEAGSPEKVYTGRSYPARKFAYRLTLVNGHTITGHILGQPLYLARDGKADRFILHDRQKGPLDSTLEDLVYLKRVVLHEAGQQAIGNGQQG